MFLEIFLGTSVSRTLWQRNLVPSIQSHSAGCPIKASIKNTTNIIMFLIQILKKKGGH